MSLSNKIVKKTRKDLEGSLDRAWFAAEPEFPETLVPRLP